MDVRPTPLDQIRELDLVSYLASLGYQPEYVRRDNDYWYLSPLRNEGKASFKVNRELNRWYDHGLSEGGNLIDFGLAYFHCSVRELMDKINVDPSFQQQLIRPEKVPGSKGNDHSQISIINDRPIMAFPLIGYLHERHIPLAVTDLFCREISYQLDGKNYYGIGFKNNSGGYEIRNAFFKCSSSPKDISIIGKGSNEVHVFEGFFDLLSFKSLYPHDPLNSPDCLVLNGAGMFERARSALEKYPVKRLWLDRDTTGLATTQKALSLNQGYRDESILYQQHKDLNEWLCQQGRGHKLRLQQKKGPRLRSG